MQPNSIHSSELITLLEWDSNFFNTKIGKVEITNPTLEKLGAIEALKRKNGFDLLYLYFMEVDSSVFDWLKDNGGQLVDQKVTFQKIIGSHELKGLSAIEIYDGDLTQKLLGLAIESGHKSRFYKDLRMRPRFNDLYTTWIEKSLSRELADEVLVSMNDSEINGFVTVKKTKEKGEIGLIAVDKDFRGTGVGKKLIVGAENWFKSSQCNLIKIVTQLDNIAACGLYLKTGFVKIKSEYIFHY